MSLPRQGQARHLFCALPSAAVNTATAVLLITRGTRQIGCTAYMDLHINLTDDTVCPTM